MAATVAGKKRDALAFDNAGDYGFRGIAEGSLDADFFAFKEAFHRIKAAAADDSDAGLRLFGRSFRLGFRQNGSLSWVESAAEMERRGFYSSIRSEEVDS